MPRKSSTLDEAVMLIQILTRIPKGRLITAQQLKQELDAAGIPIRIRTLQRYLKTMASTDVFGIDCDMRSRPYGYKQSTAGGTLLSQQMSVHECLLLRLAQEHMRFMIPTTLSKSLSPLFDMASQKFNETLSAAPRNEKAWLKKIAVVGSSLPMMPPKISRTIFEAVSEALFRELKLEIEYDSASGKQVKSLITPLGLVQQDGVFVQATEDGFASTSSACSTAMRTCATSRFTASRRPASPNFRPSVRRTFRSTPTSTRATSTTRTARAARSSSPSASRTP